MKKSLLITFDFPPVKGGVGYMLWQICSHFPSDKIVVLTKPINIPFKTNFAVYRKPLVTTSKFIWPRWIFLFWRGWRIIKKEKIEIVQAGQILPVGTVAWLYKKLFNIPYMVYVYGQDLVIVRDQKRKMKLIKSILQGAQAVIACSSYTKRLATNLGAAEEKTIVLYPCPNINIKQDIDEKALTTFLDSHQLINKKVILTVGNLVERKGYDMVLGALPEVIAKIPEVVYTIIGEGPYKKELEQKIAQLKITNHVKFLGRISNKELTILYETCNLFIMPSRDLKNERGETVDVEGFGMVFLEANLYNKPVIGGRSGGVPEAVEHNVSGLLVDPENKNDIANSLIRLLTNTVLANKLGSQGRKRVLKKFSPINEAEKIKELLK